MTPDRWIVTHATESGATRMWWVDEETAGRLIKVAKNGPDVMDKPQSIGFPTLTGAALIWLTMGQSLTVERSNG